MKRIQTTENVKTTTRVSYPVQVAIAIYYAILKVNVVQAFFRTPIVNVGQFQPVQVIFVFCRIV